MPAKLGLSVLIGAGLMIWTAIQSKAHLKWIVWSLGITIVLVFGSQALAGITGLTSGRTEANGWQLWVVLVGIIGYDLSFVALSISGILICRQLFRKPNE